MKIKKIYIFLLICGFMSNCNKSNDSKANDQHEAQTSSTYAGGWPVNSNSNNIQDPGYNLPCPGVPYAFTLT